MYWPYVPDFTMLILPNFNSSSSFWVKYVIWGGNKSIGLIFPFIEITNYCMIKMSLYMIRILLSLSVMVPDMSWLFPKQIRAFGEFLFHSIQIVFPHFKFFFIHHSSNQTPDSYSPIYEWPNIHTGIVKN